MFLNFDFMNSILLCIFPINPAITRSRKSMAMHKNAMRWFIKQLSIAKKNHKTIKNTSSTATISTPRIDNMNNMIGVFSIYLSV